MIFKTLIISVIVVAFLMLALGVKLLFNKKDAVSTAHSCALEEGDLDENDACTKCELKDIANCPENKGDPIKKSKLTSDETKNLQS